MWPKWSHWSEDRWWRSLYEPFVFFAKFIRQLGNGHYKHYKEIGAWQGCGCFTLKGGEVEGL